MRAPKKIVASNFDHLKDGLENQDYAKRKQTIQWILARLEEKYGLQTTLQTTETSLKLRRLIGAAEKIEADAFEAHPQMDADYLVFICIAVEKSVINFTKLPFKKLFDAPSEEQLIQPVQKWSLAEAEQQPVNFPPLFTPVKQNTASATSEEVSRPTV